MPRREAITDGGWTAHPARILDLWGESFAVPWLIVCTFLRVPAKELDAMRTRLGTTLLAIIVACAALTPAAAKGGQRARGRGHAIEQNHADSRQSKDTPGRGRANGSRIHQDPASAAGYENGYDLGLTDGREGQGYDPVRHRDYRDAQRGYASSYGSREGYKTNFRAGFRQGYEDGYREGTRTRK